MYSQKHTREELIANDEVIRKVEINQSAYQKMLNDPEYRKAMGYKIKKD